MKKYLFIVAGIGAAALLTTGCQSYAQTGYNDGGYRSNNGYNYGDAYGDGQPGNDNYYYNYNQQPAPNAGYQQSAVQPPVGFNDFYNQLSPYGSWVNIAPYGQVWIANVPNFQPYYTKGYWTYTTYGWTWVSDYPWGWAPFHYGRWGYHNSYGWYWVPGYVWGPAWVAWGSGSDMYGWAPLMPGMNFGVTLSMNLFPSSYWTFMPGRYMGMTNIGNYYVNRSRNVTIIKNTTIINNYGTENNRRYTMGPSATEVQRYTGRTIQPMRVTNVSDNRSAGVGSNELRVYRPVTRTDSPSSNNRTTTSAPENNNNRTVTPQTRTQQPQQPAAPQTRTQQPQQPAATPQTRTQQPQQPATPQTRGAQTTTQQEPAQPVYRPNPAQPKVKNSAAPQTTRQIQAAQNENKRVEQQRSTTSSSRNNTEAKPRR